ncbi:MAG TPA: transglutaminase domain-containing protein [Thermoanaerobaculia bacterium]|nr:transglutaminase domain-containing protein [Thermoanaerobaculia bacterium]
MNRTIPGRSAAAAWILAAAVGASSLEAAGERRFELTYEFTVHVPAGAHRVRIWAPVAVTDENQSVGKPEVTSPLSFRETREGEFGNRFLYAEEPPGGKAADIPVVVRYRVARRESAGGNPSDPPSARFLRADRLVPIDGKMKELADINTKGSSTAIEKARALYDYVFHSLRYDKSGTGWGRGDALWACDAKHGNCTDFHSVFISMARAEGIPTRFEIGFPLPASVHAGEIAGYHCWAAFYTAGAGWVPVDISEAWQDPSRHDYLFGHLDPDRIRFTTGRDLVLEPRQDGPPLNFFVYPYVEIDGEPFDGVTRRFSFQDLPEDRASR